MRQTIRRSSTSRLGESLPDYAESDTFMRRWYSEQLAAMGEPPLPRLAQPAWRFLWLRSFDPAIAVRVEPPVRMEARVS